MGLLENALMKDGMNAKSLSVWTAVNLVIMSIICDMIIHGWFMTFKTHLAIVSAASIGLVALAYIVHSRKPGYKRWIDGEVW